MNVSIRKMILLSFFLFFLAPIAVSMSEKDLQKVLKNLSRELKLEEKKKNLKALEEIKNKIEFYAGIDPKHRFGDLFIKVSELIAKEQSQEKTNNEMQNQIATLETKLNTTIIEGKNIEQLDQIKRDIQNYRELTGKQAYGNLLANLLQEIDILEKSNEMQNQIATLETKLNTTVIEGKNIEQLAQIKRDIQNYRELTGKQAYGNLLANLLQEIDILEKSKDKAFKEEAEKQVPLKLIPIEMVKRLKLAPMGKFFDNLEVSNGLKRELLQIKMAEQTEARCGGLSLINILWTKKFTKTGDVKDLTYLHNKNNVKRILDIIGCGNWVDIDRVKEYMKNADNKGFALSGIDAISSVLVLDKNLAKFLFAEEAATAQELKNKVNKGLKQDYFFQGIIVGDEEAKAGGFGHYFAFVIIKSGNQVQYIVIDSKNDNHLTDSYRLRRINYLINQLEGGPVESLVPFTRFGQMVDNLKIEIETEFSNIKKLSNVLDKQEFIKSEANRLQNILDQIDQYRLLSESQTAFQDEENQIRMMLQF